MAGGHDGDGTLPTSPRLRRVLTWVMIPLVAATLGAAGLLWPERPDPPEGTGGTFYDGTVTEVRDQLCPPEQQAAGFRRCGEVTVEVEQGPDRGREVTAPVPDGPGAPSLRAGDRVVLVVVTDPADPTAQQYNVTDHQRGVPLFLLGLLFAVVIVAFGLRRGLASLAGLAACFTLLLTFVLPGIISGHPPLLVAVVGAALVMFVIMYLVHGVSVRTSVAVLGTLGALVVTGALGYLATVATHLTGVVGDDELSLFTTIPDLDLRGVLLAGIIIGSLGVLDDVSISQAATVGELARANPRLSRWQLYRAGTRVGRAHVASVVNTLVLAYAGASLPLLLLIVLNTTGRDAGAVLIAQPIAQEIVRSVVATIGLVAAVPFTTALAAFVCRPGGAAAPTGTSAPAGAPGGVPAPARHRRVDPGEALAPEHRRPAAW
ncbi:MAG: YibE/F family protein [Micromonosporaceae bacterium]|nr:YibE/F family protein [Micromonosporaceae bacterium]